MKFRIGALTCALVAVLAASAVATAAKQPPKKKAPTFDTRYDCSKIAPPALLDSLLGSWGGNLAFEGGKADNHVYGASDVSACTLVHADGPFVSQHAGDVIIVHGPDATRDYNGDKQTATINGRKACDAIVARGQPQPSDPRVCGPVVIPGVGDQAYEAFFYTAAHKGNVFIQLGLGEAVVDGQWVDSSHLPPQDLLENALQAILARLPGS